MSQQCMIAPFILLFGNAELLDENLMLGVWCLLRRLLDFGDEHGEMLFLSSPQNLRLRCIHVMSEMWTMHVARASCALFQLRCASGRMRAMEAHLGSDVFTSHGVVLHVHA